MAGLEVEVLMPPVNNCLCQLVYNISHLPYNLIVQGWPLTCNRIIRLSIYSIIINNTEVDYVILKHAY